MEFNPDTNNGHQNNIQYFKLIKIIINKYLRLVLLIDNFVKQFFCIKIYTPR